MRTNALLAVLDREAEQLTQDNWHAAAAVVNEAAEHLRSRTRMERLVRTLLDDVAMCGLIAGCGDGGRKLIADLRESIKE